MKKEALFLILKEKIALVVDGIEGNSITETTSLKELGINSIDRAEIIMLTLEAIQMKTPMVDFAAAKNIGELCAIFQSKWEAGSRN